MPEDRLELLEERELVLRDKAAREGIDIPDEVLTYIAEKYRLPQALKGALINVSAYAARRQLPITLDIARLVLDGIRPAPKVEALHKDEPEAAKDGAERAEEDTRDAVVQAEEDMQDAVRPDAELPALSPETPTAAYEVDSSPEPTLASAQEEKPLIFTEQDVVQGTLFDTLETPLDFDRVIEEETELDFISAEKVGRAEDVVFSDELEQSSDDDFIDEPFFEEEALLVVADEEDDDEGVETGEDEDRGPAVPERVKELTGGKRKSRVFFVPMRTRRKRSLIERVGMALTRAGLNEIIEGGDKVAVKVHFGEAGNTGFVSPIYVREVVRLIKELGGKPFLTDANTLYTGQRANAIDHLECALANGFSYTSVQAPLIIADGLNGHEGVDVPINGKNCQTVRIGAAAAEADAMVVISHVKGHGEAGFGAALKNVGMGLGTRSAKQRMHSDVKPLVFSPNCTKCGRCVSWCPVQCISIGPKPEDKATIDSEHCIGCGECVAACAYDAIKINWDSDPTSFQEKIVEHAQGALNTKGDKVIYLNFLTNVTPECDCWKFSDAAIVPDIGVLASRDIVAIDQASLDLVKKAVGSADSRGEGLPAGSEKFAEIHKVDARIAINYAEEVGLGTTEYLITEIG